MNCLPFISRARWPSLASCTPIRVLTTSQGDRLVSPESIRTEWSLETVYTGSLWGQLFICSLTHSLMVHLEKKKSWIQIPTPPKKKMFVLKKKKKKSGDLRTRAGALSAWWSYSLITACCVAQLNTISQKALKIQYPFSQTVCLSIPSHPPALNQPTTELLWTATDFPCSAAKQNHTVSYF